MNFKDLLSISTKNLIRNKKYFFVFLINLICLTIFLFSIVIFITYKEKLSNNINNNPLMTTIGINFSDRNEEISEEQINNVLNNIIQMKHVNGYFHQNYAHSGGYTNEDNNEIVILEPLFKNNLPDLSYKQDLEDGEIIIPQKFYNKYYSSIDEVNKENIIDGNSLIGKMLEISFDVFDCKTEKYVEKRKIKVKVVGTYDSSLTGLKMFYCFANLNTIKQIQDNVMINITDVYKTSDLYYIQIDNYNNIESIKQKIKKMGYSIDEGLVSINSNYYNTYVYLMNFISIISLIFLIIIKILFINKIMNDNKKYIFINVLNGYELKYIIAEETIKNIIINLLSIITSTIMIAIAIKIYNNTCFELIEWGYYPKIPYFIIFSVLIIISIIDYYLIKIIIENKKGLISFK